MNWEKLLAENRVAREPTSKKEIDELRRMVDSNVKDSMVEGLSSQGRYEFAYNAARLMATIAVRASGYRVIAKNGHHYFTFQALQAVDVTFWKIAMYFDQARDRRNEFAYDHPVAISDTDAKDLIGAVARFIDDVEKWISRHQAALTK